MIFVHGAGGGGWQWRDWAGVFAGAGFETCAEDLQPAADGLAATRFDDYLAQVRAWILNVPAPPIVVGASLGGLLALAAAEEAPVRAVVAVNAVPPWGLDGPARERDWPATVPWSTATPFASTAAAMPEADPDTQRWAHVRWRDESGTVMKAVSQGWPLRKSAHPLLVVCGQADREIPLSQCRKLAAWANASLLEQPDASHVGVLLGAHAHATAEQVVAWLREAGLTP